MRAVLPQDCLASAVQQPLSRAHPGAPAERDEEERVDVAGVPVSAQPPLRAVRIRAREVRRAAEVDERVEVDVGAGGNGEAGQHQGDRGHPGGLRVVRVQPEKTKKTIPYEQLFVLAFIQLRNFLPT